MKLLVFACLISVSLCAEVCYPPCGCFNDDPPFNTRPLPESWEEAEIIWLLYTQSNRNFAQEVTLPNIVPPSNFDPSKPTDFLIHGWNSNPNTMALVRDAILDHFDHNVFVVDWRAGAGRVYYPASASNTQVTGACSAYVADQLTDMGSVHCIGHSLGGQTCGYMGKRSQPSGTATMKRATGLDPAGPWFDSDDTRLRIDKGDAFFVDLIHTNGEGFGALGMGRPIGHADFFPNKAGRQPGCNTGSCDHSICRNFFAASITSSDACDFDAYPCNSPEDADAGLCESCSGSDCQKQGWYADTMPGEGSYFLRTVAAHPYCES